MDKPTQADTNKAIAIAATAILEAMYEGGDSMESVFGVEDKYPAAVQEYAKHLDDNPLTLPNGDEMDGAEWNMDIANKASEAIFGAAVAAVKALHAA